MRQIFLVSIIFYYISSGCAAENLAESITENTPDEEARIALEEEDWELCITRYEALITSEPAEYSRYPLLATCYAGRAGIDLLNVVKSQLEGGGDGGGDIFSLIGGFVPAEPSTQQLGDIGLAISRLEQMPAAHRSAEGGYEYSAEANFQLNLYLASSNAMLVNKYSETDADGNVDEEKLNEMTDEEVDDFFNNLDSIVAANEGENEGLAEGVAEAVADINAMEGDTQKEKLINYLARDNQA